MADCFLTIQDHKICGHTNNSLASFNGIALAEKALKRQTLRFEHLCHPAGSSCYNVIVLVSVFGQSCVPDTVWATGYVMSLLLSTQPVTRCTKPHSKNTFKSLLLLQYKNIDTT